MDLLNNIVSQINDIFWSYILIILLIAAGIILVFAHALYKFACYVK